MRFVTTRVSCIAITETSTGIGGHLPSQSATQLTLSITKSSGEEIDFVISDALLKVGVVCFYCTVEIVVVVPKLSFESGDVGVVPHSRIPRETVLSQP